MSSVGFLYSLLIGVLTTTRLQNQEASGLFYPLKKNSKHVIYYLNLQNFCDTQNNMKPSIFHKRYV